MTYQVHNYGSATVAVASKKLIEEYSKKMQGVGFTVSIAPDDDFAGEDGADDPFGDSDGDDEDN